MTNLLRLTPINGISNSITEVSQNPYNASIGVFARFAPTAGSFSNPRLAFYSIGESLDLALLDARVTALIGAFAAAIP